MNLHEDQELFAQMLADTAAHLGISDTEILEKDYFVTLFLQKIAEKQPGVIFKGGSSLSKCHTLISRFSEDINIIIYPPKKRCSLPFSAGIFLPSYI